MLLHASGVFNKNCSCFVHSSTPEASSNKDEGISAAVKKYSRVLCLSEKWPRYLQNSAGIEWFFSPFVSNIDKLYALREAITKKNAKFPDIFDHQTNFTHFPTPSDILKGLFRHIYIANGQIKCFSFSFIGKV